MLPTLIFLLNERTAHGRWTISNSFDGPGSLHEQCHTKEQMIGMGMLTWNDIIGYRVFR